MKRTMAFCLALLCVLPLAVTACGGAKEETAQTAAVTTAEPENKVQYDEYGQEILPLSVPDDKDFGGKELIYLCRDREDYRMDFGPEEQNGEVINDALYTRNLKTEEYLNIKHKTVLAENSNYAINDAVINSVTSGDQAYDIVETYQFYGGSNLAPQGYLYNVYKLPFCDFEKPWWNQDFVDTLTVSGLLFYTVGSMNLNAFASMKGMFFNQQKVTDIYKDYNFLYEEVYDGKWTLDRFMEIVSDVYTDVNGDGTADPNDFYGLAVCESDPGPWLPALGIRLCTPDGKGGQTLTLFNEHTVNAYDKLWKLYKESKGVYYGPGDFEETLTFLNGQAMMINCNFTKATTVLRDMKDTYGILPMPKYDEAQEGYYNETRDDSNLTCIPADIKDAEVVGAALETLNYYGYYEVIPVFFEVAMKSKYLADSNSAKMFDIIVNGMKVDFGAVNSLAISGGSYSMKGTYHVQVRNLMRPSVNIKDFASNYATYEPTYTKCLADLLAAYAKLAEEDK